jgi:hypothetical protein
MGGTSQDLVHSPSKVLACAAEPTEADESAAINSVTQIAWPIGVLSMLLGFEHSILPLLMLSNA